MWKMNLLELNHVEKSFGDLSVLKDISLSVGEGEIVSIIGPSGSGKSTLLRCATMLETMDHGEIVYLGKRAAWTGADGKVSYADKKDMKEIRSQYGGALQSCSACLSVLTPINSTPAIASSTILFTALLPAPPTPITMILAADSASFVIISNKGISSFAYASLFFYNIVICPNNQDNFKISY